MLYSSEILLLLIDRIEYDLTIQISDLQDGVCALVRVRARVP